MKKTSSITDLANLMHKASELPRMKGRAGLVRKLGDAMRFIKSHKMEDSLTELIAKECHRAYAAMAKDALDIIDKKGVR